MYVYAPVEYFMLTEYERISQTKNRVAYITLANIEKMTIHSNNPMFKTTRFRHSIIAFKRYGFYPREKAKWCLRDALNYAINNNDAIYRTLKESAGYPTPSFLFYAYASEIPFDKDVYIKLHSFSKLNEIIICHIKHIFLIVHSIFTQ